MIPTHGAASGGVGAYSGGAILFSTPPQNDVAPSIEEELQYGSLETAAELLGTTVARVADLLGPNGSGQTLRELLEDVTQQLDVASREDSEDL
jgi:hypothetical protein